MNNTVLDAHNILMEQLERLNDIEATDLNHMTAKQLREIKEKIEVESERTKAMVMCTAAIAQNANLVIQGYKYEKQMHDVPEIFSTKKASITQKV